MLCDRCKVELKTHGATKLTKYNKRIYDYVADVVESRGVFPSLFDIALHFKYKSLSVVHKHLDNLEKAGYIYNVNGKRHLSEFWLNKDRD